MMTISWEIHANWGTQKLGDIAPEDSTQINPSGYPDETFNYWGLDAIEKGVFEEPDLNIIKGAQVSSTCVEFDTSNVLYAKLRPYLNKVIVPSVQGIGSTEWVPLKPDPTKLNRHYLAYVLRTSKFVQYAGINSTGARMPRVRKSALWEADIPLPFPTEPKRSLILQRRIVARIEALLAEVREMRRLNGEITADTERLMSAILAKAFSEISTDIPSDRAIDSFTTVSSGGTPSRSRLEYYIGKIPWIKTGELKDNVIYQSEEHITQTAIDESSAKLFPVETLLIAMYGQGQTRGRTGVLGIEATTNQACCAIYPQPAEFHSRYLQYWFRHMYSELRRRSEARGGTQPNLNQTIIKKLKPPLPNIKVQERYAAYFGRVENELEEIWSINNNDAQLIVQLEQSILAQAFRGEL